MKNVWRYYIKRRKAIKIEREMTNNCRISFDGFVIKKKCGTEPKYNMYIVRLKEWGVDSPCFETLSREWFLNMLTFRDEAVK